MKIIERIIVGLIIVLFACMFMTGLSGCEKQQPIVRGPSGAELIGSELVAETQGCKIYRVDTSSLPVTYLYMTKCDFDKTSASHVSYRSGKNTSDVSNLTSVVPTPPTPPVPPEPELPRRQQILNKLTPEERVILALTK